MLRTRRVAFMKDLTNSVNWLWQTLSLHTPAEKNGDVSGWIARWLFRIGTIWAVILIPITAVSGLIFVMGIEGLFLGMPLKSTDRGWLIGPYLLAGYGIWLGWGWRSRKPGNLLLCCLFWLTSAAFNVMEPIHIWQDSHNFLDLLFPPPLWGIITTIGSLAALISEFVSPTRNTLPK